MLSWHILKGKYQSLGSLIKQGHGEVHYKASFYKEQVLLSLNNGTVLMIQDGCNLCLTVLKWLAKEYISIPKLCMSTPLRGWHGWYEDSHCPHAREELGESHRILGPQGPRREEIGGCLSGLFTVCMWLQLRAWVYTEPSNTTGMTFSSVRTFSLVCVTPQVSWPLIIALSHSD